MSLADLYYTKDATGGAFKTEVSGVVSSPGPHPTGALLKVNRGGKSYFIKGGSKMIADRARAMMAAGKVIPELEVQGSGFMISASGVIWFIWNRCRTRK